MSLDSAPSVKDAEDLFGIGSNPPLDAFRTQTAQGALFGLLLSAESRQESTTTD
ncbi:MULTISPECIES: hypothetical protein [unclassified Nonomuraea]|uniref:hypothetical protein n=1 Tax=unclassified Nonomuraea TaxID=2593643 RepID=UPI0033D74FCF